VYQRETEVKRQKGIERKGERRERRGNITSKLILDMVVQVYNYIAV
jgi:hypothetical protein